MNTKTYRSILVAILSAVGLLGCNELAGIRPAVYDPCLSSGSTGGAVDCSAGGGGSSSTG